MRRCELTLTSASNPGTQPPRNVRCWHKRMTLGGCRLWLKMAVEDVVRETAGAGRTFGGSFADLQRNGHQVRARKVGPERVRRWP